MHLGAYDVPSGGPSLHLLDLEGGHYQNLHLGGALNSLRASWQALGCLSQRLLQQVVLPLQHPPQQVHLHRVHSTASALCLVPTATASLWHLRAILTASTAPGCVSVHFEPLSFFQNTSMWWYMVWSAEAHTFLASAEVSCGVAPELLSEAMPGSPAPARRMLLLPGKMLS